MVEWIAALGRPRRTQPGQADPLRRAQRRLLKPSAEGRRARVPRTLQEQPEAPNATITTLLHETVMPNRLPMPPKEVLESLRKGGVIPAHPLALNRNRKLDERRQRALTRYYMAAGADGLAVGVHTTQFAIRDAKVGLFRPVLELAAETITAHSAARKRLPIVRVAGICGDTRAGRGRSAPGGRSRLSHRPAEPRRPLESADRQADRARPRGFRSHSADGLLPAAFGRRPHSRLRFLAAVRRDRKRGRRSRWRRSTATRRSTSCARWSKPAAPKTSRSTPATTTTSSTTC